ncbi:MAG: dihydrodipicolinate synthase family protein [Mesorhizobium sp.]|nr:MAG: dihydrodipicolinate synthase family protein [Mesorhizobium sp.]
MWAGVFPAVTTKFTPDDRLDHAEMERCFSLQMEAGCDGIIVCGSLGEGPMLSHDEKIEVLKTAQKVAGTKPVLLTVNEPGTREAASIARRAAKEGANGLMVVPSPIYHTNAEETVAALRAVAEAGDLPVMIYSNRLAYRVGWVAGLVTAFPRETVAIYQLMRKGRREEALKIYRWFRPLLDLDVSTYLVQNIKLAEVLAIGTNDRVRMPRQPLSGERRKAVEKIVRDALAARPELPAF